MSRLRILLVARSEPVADAVMGRLQEEARYFVTKKIISNGHTDPLHDAQSRPDVLLLHYIPGYGELEFLAESAAAGLANLKGHRSVGGMRASIYNAFPLEGVQKLVAFMADFAKKNG